MQCPGQDSRYWDDQAIFETNCTMCGEPVEFFKDDSTRTCKKCGHRMANPKMDFGCAAYCPHAKRCIGELPREFSAPKKEFIKERVAVEMKKYFGSDFRRIGHATRVARYAQQINEKEGGRIAVVLVAAFLHDIGIKNAEEKFGSSAAHLQHQEGPPVAREILERLGADEKLIEEVCDIIGHHHHPRQEETTNFKVLYDADLITNLEEEQKEHQKDRERMERIIAKSFYTNAGRELAGKVLLGI